MRGRRLKDKERSRGQTTVETLFVFSSIIFFAFAIPNLAIALHTRSVATYAAFMAARSFQVYGDQQGEQFFQETGADQKPGELFKKENTLMAIRAAEDIYTCALPWMSVPPGDADNTLDTTPPDKKTFTNRCMEGKRKYKNLNIGSSLAFLPFKKDSQSFLAANNDPGINAVVGGFSEDKRDPMRYGILRLQYRPAPPLLNPIGLFNANLTSDNLAIPEVDVPFLLNPGLAAKLKKDDSKDAKTSNVFKAQ